MSVPAATVYTATVVVRYGGPLLWYIEVGSIPKSNMIFKVPSYYFTTLGKLGRKQVLA